MRAGLMDRTIKIQRVSTLIDDYGTPAETWVDLVTLRAQQVKTSTDEFIRGYGASDETVVVFRTWWIDGITNADRIIFNGMVHEIKETKEIGRRNGLEFRTLSLGIVPTNTPLADWVTLTAYTSGPPPSIVAVDGEIYLCLIPHTSGIFAIDLAVSKWLRIA